MFTELLFESHAMSLVLPDVGISAVALSTLLSQRIHTCLAWTTWFTFCSPYVTFLIPRTLVGVLKSQACRPGYPCACSSFLHLCSNLFQLAIPLQSPLHYFLVVIIKILKAFPKSQKLQINIA